MTTRRVRIRRLRAAAAAGIFVVSGPLVSGPEALAQADAASPIQHLIVVIEENHSFDNVYGTYTPGPGQSIDNLLSKGIVNADGSPGPNVALAVQHTASDTVAYSLDPSRTGAYNPSRNRTRPPLSASRRTSPTHAPTTTAIPPTRRSRSSRASPRERHHVGPEPAEALAEHGHPRHLR